MDDNSQFKRDKRSPIPKSGAVSKLMSRIKGKNTKLEMVFRKALYEKGIRGYRVNYKNLPGKPDIAFIGKKKLIFINGCFWHGCNICGRRIPKHNSDYWSNKIEKNIARDKRRKKQLESQGYHVIEIWEHEIKKELEKTIDKVVELLGLKE
jgi:DNA mismatch endonuclease (patch repair protein)